MSESATLAIIGISCLFPKADDLQAYWSNIKNGVDAITPIPESSHWNIADYYDPDPKASDRTYARRGGFISPVDFDPMEFGISPKDIEATDTTQLLGMVAAKQALRDAGYDEKPFNRARTSVILGVTGALELVIPLGARLGHPIWRRALKEAGVAEDVAEDVVKRIADSYVGWQENSFPGLLGNVAAGRIASRLDLGGTNCVVDAACASSMAALHLACLELAAGRSDLVITGGIDTFNDIFMFMCFSKTPALSPTGDAKPFDKDCDGTIIGEGLGMLVLKRLADAERDGDRIYAVIKGLGTSSDGRGNAVYAPRAEGQRAALDNAYRTTQVTPDTIELVEAHGTGTKIGDATEVRSLIDVYRQARPEGSWAALGSVKSQIGHTKAAAGMAGLIKAALALQHKVLPPTIKVSQPVAELAPGCSPFYVNTRKRPWLSRPTHPRRAGVSAFGFGGTNFHCVLEEHGGRRAGIGWDGDVEILALTGDRIEDLRAEVTKLPGAPPWSEFQERARQSRAEFRPEAKFRLLFPVAKETVLGTLRDGALTMLDKHPEKTSWTLPNGLAFGAGERRGKLGVLFPGQGSQYAGMLGDLACQFPAMLDALEDANRVFAREHPDAGPQRLSDFIYPQPAFSEEAGHQQEEALKATDIAQPAIGAVSLGALNVLACFGVTPEAAAGHSYGELSALCGGGRLQPESLHVLSNVRGRLMACRNGHSDRGAMLAVQAEEQWVNDYIRQENTELVVANRNSPRQFVLAGPKKNIEQAAGDLANRSVRARLLPVSAAFHSPLVADARAPFAAALDGIAFHRGRIPVYANATARAYPAGAKQARDLLASQMVSPVDFLAQIQAMHEDGVATFLELGPGHVLSDLVHAILPDKAVESIALDSSRGKRSGTFDLAVALCRLVALGHPVELSRWEPPKASAGPTGKRGFAIPLAGANHRGPRAVRPPVSPVSPTHSLPPPSVPKADAPAFPARVAATLPVSGVAIPARTMAPAELTAALQMAQQGMLSLQQLQEQTAQLHRQFLETQEAARRTIESLLGQRRELLGLPSVTSSVTPPIARPVVMPLTAPAASPLTVLATPLAATSSAAPAPVIPRVAPAPSPQPSATDAIAPAVLEVVAEKTGYPVEMLHLEMGLDSDLGIDSIKRVEIMAALRGRLPGAPEIKPEHLGTLQTLRQVVEFLGGGQRVAPPIVPDEAPQVAPDRASQVLLGVVAEKTGYPVEMLHLEMGLDSDLGIDSIKRVEIMAALRAQLPESPEIKPEHLGTLQTLGQIVAFLTAGRGADKPGTLPGPLNDRALDAGRAGEVVLAVVAEKTGYPVEMLQLEMGLDSDLGIDSIKRVEIMAAVRAQLPEAPEIKPEHLGTLQTLAQVVAFLTGATGTPIPGETEAPRLRAELPPAAEPVGEALRRQTVKPVLMGETDDRAAVKLAPGSLIWITDDGSELAPAVDAQLRELGYGTFRGSPDQLLTDGRPPAGLVILWPVGGKGGEFLKEVFRLLQVAAPSLRRVEAGGIFVTVSRLDGVFGFGRLNGKSDPLSGGLAGLAKTARHEWPEVHCKAIDLDPEIRSGPEAADRIIAEMFHAGPVEVGVSGVQRYHLRVETVPFAETAGEPVLAAGDLVVVTGGARGITAAAAFELARQRQPRLVLLGRTRLEAVEPEWLSGLTGELEIKKALLARADGHGTPRQIETAYREVAAQREIREQLAKMRATGADARYQTVDVRDAAGVRNVIEELRRQFGPVRGLIHGAGVLADRRIEDKTGEQFDLVYDTKVAGLSNLLAAVGDDELKLVALFSSYTGRYGRVGQVDYAAANEVLNKIAQVESRRRPHCRVVSFNWGPWNGGMVSEGLRQVFAREGVGLIEPRDGARFFVREISTRNDPAVEVLAMGASPKGNGHEVGEPAPEKTPVFHLAFEQEVSVAALPCLESHVLNGRAVLPTALMIEWLAHGAVHGHPGMAFHGFENFKVLKGLVLEPGKAVAVAVMAGNGRFENGVTRVPAQLVSQAGDRRILHARADVLLAELPLATPDDTHEFTPPRHHAEPQTVYGDGRLFHGPHFHAIETLEGCSRTEVVALVNGAPAPPQWIRDPLRSGWLADPLAFDASFQMMILWSWEHRQAASLPCAIQSYRQFAPSFPKSGGRVVIRVTSSETPVVTADIQFFDLEGRLLGLAEGYECVVDAALRDAFQRNRL